MRFTSGSIAVIGGGNIGTHFACALASQGYCVNVHSSRPDEYDGTLEIIDEFDNVTTGRINMVSSDIGEVVDGCDLVIVTHPAHMFAGVAKRLLPYVHDKMNILAVPGSGGAEFAFHECLKAGATLYGLQRVPAIARLEKYGKRVRAEGKKPRLHVASIPSHEAKDMAEFMEKLWKVPCDVLPNYLSVTLTPSNPILHTTRLRTLFADYEEGKKYDRNPFFYGEWTDESSKLLIACDDELQDMLKVMSRLDLSAVRSLKLHYESDTIEAMTAKLRSIKSLNKLLSPMKQVEGGWIPDFGSRYFTADFPYGLAIIEELADILGVNAVNIRETMDWYRSVTGDRNRLDLTEYGIRNPDDIYSYYMRLEN